MCPTILLFMVSLYIAMFSCDVDCALIILQLNSPIHTVSFRFCYNFSAKSKTGLKALFLNCSAETRLSVTLHQVSFCPNNNNVFTMLMAESGKFEVSISLQLPVSYLHHQFFEFLCRNNPVVHRIRFKRRFLIEFKK